MSEELNKESKEEISEKPPEKYNCRNIFFIVVLIILVFFIICHTYYCFCENRDLECNEDYINGPPRTDPQFDEAFDVEREVKKLIQLQEEYLEKLQRYRLGN